MDRFALLYTRGTPSAIQDRITTYRYSNDELDSLCDLLNNLSNSLGDLNNDWTEERRMLSDQLDRLEGTIDGMIGDHSVELDRLYGQIEDLEYEIDRLNAELREAQRELQSRSATA